MYNIAHIMRHLEDKMFWHMRKVTERCSPVYVAAAYCTCGEASLSWLEAARAEWAANFKVGDL